MPCICLVIDGKSTARLREFQADVRGVASVVRGGTAGVMVTCAERLKGNHVRAPVGYQQHILVIDESPEILLVMREILCEEGYRVSLRPNPDRCVEEATSLAPDLIIIDFPWNAVENRWTLLEGLHHDDNTSAIPVILCTGSAREVSDHRVRLDEMGIPIVLKPFDIESLLMEINARLCKRHLSPGADGSG